MPESLELLAISKRNRCRSKLVDLSDGGLVNIFEDAKQRFGDIKITSQNIASLPKEVYEGGAAIDVLRERYGPYYVEKLTGTEQPFFEKFSYIMFSICKAYIAPYVKSFKRFLNDFNS